MTKQIINLGQTANDRTGDPLRTAFQKVNENFDELYALAGADIQIPAQTNNGGKFLTTNGTTLSWSSISQEVGTANTGFVDDRIYNLNGPVVSNDDLVHGPTARLSLPEYGDTVNPISLYNNYGNFSILLGTNGNITSTWTFQSTGELQIPGNIKQNNSWTRTTTNGFQTGSSVIWSSLYDYVSSVKLVIQVECNEVGDSSGWHSQACEAIISSRGYSNAGAGVGEPAMSVYGVVHTSVDPLITFTVQRNSTTKLIELVATTTITAGQWPSFRIHSVEMATTD